MAEIIQTGIACVKCGVLTKWPPDKNVEALCAPCFAVEIGIVVQPHERMFFYSLEREFLRRLDKRADA